MKKSTKDELCAVVLIILLGGCGSIAIVDETQRPAFMNLAGPAISAVSRWASSKESDDKPSKKRHIEPKKKPK